MMGANVSKTTTAMPAKKSANTAVVTSTGKMKFGSIIGIAPGDVEAYSSHYKSADPDAFPTRSSYLAYYNGIYSGHKYQCVEFARRWLIQTNRITFGDVHMAYEIFDIDAFATVGDKSEMKVPVERTANGNAGHIPVLGSVLLWKPRGHFSHTGHVAIVTHAAHGKLGVAEQNVSDASWNGKPYARELDYTVDPKSGRITIVDRHFAETEVLGWVTPVHLMPGEEQDLEDHLPFKKAPALATTSSSLPPIRSESTKTAKKQLTPDAAAADQTSPVEPSSPAVARAVKAAVIVDVSDDELRRNGRYVPLVLAGGGIGYNTASKALLEEVGGIDGLVTMTQLFYDKFWADQYLKQFLGELHTPLTTHARRIAMYIAEMMGAKGQPWTINTQNRTNPPAPVANGRSVVVDSRQSAHMAAWHSKTRPAHRVGRRFKLDDCRVWMRLMFWACRESGLANNAVFFSYFQRWIGHFIPIYEQSAAVFTRESARWSANPRNIEKYLADGRIMTDVLDVPYQVAIQSLPGSERNDSDWVYE